MADLFGNHLINGNAGAHIRRALVQPHAGQEHAVATRVIAAAVRPAIGANVIKSVPAMAPEFDGDVRRAEETMDNGGLLQKWRDCEKILTNRGAAEVEKRAAARASRAAPVPPQLPPPRQSDLASSFNKPTGAVDVFKKIVKAPSASDAFDFLLSASPPRTPPTRRRLRG